MASIALITNDTAGTTNTRIGEALTAGGHTFTSIDDVNVGTTNFSSYDLILLGFLDSALVTATAAKLKELNQSGKPVIVTGVGSGQSAGTGKSFVATNMDLCSSENMGFGTSAGRVNPNATGAAHEIFTGYTAGTSYQALGAAAGDYASALIGHNGTALAVGNSTTNLTNNAVVVIWESGAETGVWKLGNRIVFLGFLYNGGSDYSADGDIFIQRAVTWALAGVVTALNTVDAQTFRAFAVIGAPQDKVSVETFRTYAVIAPPATEISISVFRAYVVLGEAGLAPPIAKKRRVQNINFFTNQDPTDILIDNSSVASTAAVDTTIGTFSTVGGTPPYTYEIIGE